ncbi:hypothetical protein EJ02DRAFT_510131 [Clathrospora elynae]|uniref:Aminoglycoside phosphotransferase domain-containing protein n=1 Tax=Clathrospora elynae TaxID=706981 RepID=A0A6A5SX16_9PLEO|nr:hypothetical protein EJ02DRAFT_510131 [Clathrospora elynae]
MITVPGTSPTTIRELEFSCRRNASFDKLAETDGDAEFQAWLSKLVNAKQDVVAFVTRQLESDTAGELDSYLKGSFNLDLVVKLGDGGKAVIRFPKPGHTATSFREKKVRNEACFLHYVRDKTTISVPYMLRWGMTQDTLCQLGPFMIMEYIHGTTLSNLLKKPTETDQDEVILATDVENAKLDYVYERLDFPAIGVKSKNPWNEWTANERPLSYDMNELATRLLQAPVDNGTPRYTGLWQFFRMIGKHEGMTGLSGGLTPHIARFIPNNRLEGFLTGFQIFTQSPDAQDVPGMICIGTCTICSLISIKRKWISSRFVMSYPSARCPPRKSTAIIELSNQITPAPEAYGIVPLIPGCSNSSAAPDLFSGSHSGSLVSSQHLWGEVQLGLDEPRVLCADSRFSNVTQGGLDRPSVRVP